MDPDSKKSAEPETPTVEDGVQPSHLAKRGATGLTASELVAEFAAGHAPILKATRDPSGVQVHAESLSTAIGKAAASGFGLTAGNLASAYLSREMAHGRLDVRKIAAGIAGIEKLNLGAFAQVGLTKAKFDLGALRVAAAGGLTADVIGQWRDTLAIGQIGAQAEIAGAMARRPEQLARISP